MDFRSTSAWTLALETPVVSNFWQRLTLLVFVSLSGVMVSGHAHAWRHDCDGDGKKETYEREQCPLKSNEDCNYNLNYKNTKVRYCRTRALSYDNRHVKQAVVFVHGHDIKARKYFDRLVDLASAQGVDFNETTILAPFFMHEEDVESIGLSSDHRHWDDAGWKRGKKSVNSSGTNYSSYKLMDSLSECSSSTTRLSRRSSSLAIRPVPSTSRSISQGLSLTRLTRHPPRWISDTLLWPPDPTCGW